MTTKKAEPVLAKVPRRPRWSNFARVGRKKVRGEMSPAERKFRTEFLDPEIANGGAREIWYERVSFTLTDKTPSGRPGVRYTPDFMVQYTDGELVFFEVKGYATSIHKRALNEVKMFADMFAFRVYVATAQTKANGGGFKIEEY